MHSRPTPQVVHPDLNPLQEPAAHGLGSDVTSCLSKSSVNPLGGYSVSFDGCSQDVTSVTTIYGLTKWRWKTFLLLTLSTQGANILAHGLYMRSAMHQYIGVGDLMCVSSEATRAFGVNPFLLSNNKCRPHLSTYITRREGRKGGVSSSSFEKDCQNEALSST